MDEFSFPSLAQDQQDSHFRRLLFPHFASSPLWFLPSAGGDHHRSLSSLDDALRHADMRGSDPELASADGGSRRFLDEERMDMLWEDLNEEAAMRRASCEQKKVVATTSTKARRLDSLVLMSRRRSSVAAEQQQPPLVEAKSGGGGGGGFIHRRRPSLILMVKVLKKLLLIQKAVSAKKQALRYQNP